MNVATRLRGAFAIYIVLLATVVVYDAAVIRRAVASGRAITEIAARHRAASTDQTGRATLMTSDVEKYLVTSDADYLAEAIQTGDAFGHELARLDSLPLTGDERRALAAIAADWNGVVPRLRALGELPGNTPSELRRAAATRVEQDLGRARAGSEQLGAAAQDAMGRELTLSQNAAGAAERLSWIAALGALGLSILLSALIARSIIGPLDRLAKGTRAVAAGQYDYRLAARGDDELAQVARDFNSMTERLGELDRMKRDFAAKVSHDLKTPLSSMQEAVRAILDGVAGELSAKQRQLLEMNLESSQRLSAMVGKLLDLSRIEAGLTPDLTMVDLAALARASIERFRAAGAERGVEIALTEPAHRVLVRGDAAGLAQVVDNLLENALKFSPAGGRIAIAIAPPGAPSTALPAGVRRRIGGGATELTVADQGPGVPDADKERIFTRFYQADAGRALRGRGVGLGLTICREIVDAHGGALWVGDNADGAPHGSVFHVVLPNGVSAADSQAATPVDVTRVTA